MTNISFFLYGAEIVRPGFTATCVINVYYHQNCKFEPLYCIKHHYVIKFNSDFLQISLFFSGYSCSLHQEKPTPRNNWNIVDSGIEHHIPMSIFPIGTICSAHLGLALETRIYLKANCLRIISQIFLRINLHFSLPHN